MLTGQEDVSRFGKGNLTGQSNGRSPTRVQGPPGFGYSEGRPLARYPDLGALEDLGAPSDGVALHSGNNRDTRVPGLQ